jgi:23S rRNA (guanosine2251-2'-O)-methyltransferase
MQIYGVNPVLEALRAGTASEVIAHERAGGSGAGGRRLRDLLALAGRLGVPVRFADRATLDRLARGGVHQGVAASVRVPEAWTPTALAAAAPGPPLIVVLDGIEDPHNVGAILRTVEAAGATGVVRQTRRAAPLTGAVARASAGAVAHVRVADVTNVARAVEELKAAGVWTVGLAAGAPARYDQVDFRLPTAVVLGAEGSGLRRLVRERCDLVAAIPMAGHVGSLNVSVAAGVVLFEATRQRRPVTT